MLGEAHYVAGKPDAPRSFRTRAAIHPLSTVWISRRHTRLIGVEARLLFLGPTSQHAHKVRERDVGLDARRFRLPLSGRAPRCDLALQLLHSWRRARMLRVSASCSAASRA